MKKIIICLLCFLLSTYPNYLCGLENETNYLYINKTNNFEINNLEFEDVTFIDNSNDSSLNFGLSCNIINNTNILDYKIIVYYYNESYSLLGKTSNYYSLIKGDNSIKIMSNLNIISNNNVDDIIYYSVSVESTNDIKKVVLTPSLTDESNNYDFVIDKYNIIIDVNEDNSYDITEEITAYFNKDKHGIYRTLPLKNEITRLDGKTETNRVLISNLEVNKDYTTSVSLDTYTIQIGSSSYTVNGEQFYKINYNYKLSRDKTKDYDELYFNIIGLDWDTLIGNVTFEINMPKEFDSSKLGFSSGSKGSTTNSVIYNVDGTKITGKYVGILNPNEGITVRCELPENYFDNKLSFSQNTNILLLISTGIFCLTVLLWLIFGKNKKSVEVVEFYPPDNLNSLELAYIYKGKVKSKDIISLLIYLCNKGYIKISETDTKSFGSKENEFKITRLKDYDGNSLEEKMFFEGLFKANRSIDYRRIMNLISEGDKNGVKVSYDDAVNQILNEKTNEKYSSVLSYELYNSFYSTIDIIKKHINESENKTKFFTKSSIIVSKIVKLFIILVSVCTLFLPVLVDLSASSLFLSVFSVGLLGGIIICFILQKNTVTRIVSLIASIPFLAVGFSLFKETIIYETLIIDTSYIIGIIISIIMIILTSFIYNRFYRRTEYANNLYGKIKGFKRFLLISDKAKLETLVLKNPTYFYDILPYTYVLGISDKWIKKFEQISVKVPENFECNGEHMNLFIASTISSMNKISASCDSQSISNTSSGSSSSSDGFDGGSSSGGGSSGGGSGGGGGGSW